jgi:hypothetical protein
MTGGSPWAAPPETGPQQAPIYPPPPAAMPPQSGPPVPPVAPPPRPPRRLPWLLIGGAVVVLIAVIAATAAVTYAVARNTNAPNATAPPATPAFSEADQAAAKQTVCQVFDVSVRGQQDQGGVRLNGQPNLPLMLRSLNSVVAVQNALIPAVPQDVATAARRYIDANLKLTTAATGITPIEDVNRLNAAANDATFAFADACGLQR